MDLEEAKAFLSTCKRWELRDHAFGDTEMGWSLGGEDVATGYFGGGNASVSIFGEGHRFHAEGEDAQQLRQCGLLKAVGRNDSTGPDEYAEGVMMDGLKMENVFKEITTPVDPGPQVNPSSH